MDRNTKLAMENVQLGIKEANAKNFKKAIKYFQAALEYQKNPNFYNLLGLANQKLDKYEKAKKFYKKAINLDPHFFIAYNNLANIYKLSNQTKLAKKYYKKALNLNKNLAEAYNNLGIIYLNERKLDKAEKYLQKANLLDPSYIPLYFQISALEKEKGNKKRSQEYAKEYLKRGGTDPKAYLIIANTYKENGKLDEANKIFKKIIQLDPKNTEAYYNLATLYLSNGQLDKAIEYYKKTIEINPRFKGAWNDLGATYYKRNEFDMAIKTLRQSIKTEPENFRGHYHLGLVYQLKNDLDKSEKYLREALKGNPNLHPTLNLLLVTLMHKRSWKEIEKISKRLDEISDKQLNEGVRTNEVPFLNVIRCNNPKRNYEIAKSWGKSMSLKAKKVGKPFVFHPRKKRKLRIGYVSYDFFDHATSHLITGLFREHDKKRFKIYIYSYGPDDKSKYRKKIIQYANKFVNITKLGNLEVAERIYNDKIDILVDLKQELILLIMQ